MKKLLIFVIAMAILLSACEDQERSVPTPNPIPYVNKFNCKINGKYWEVIPKYLSGLHGQDNTIFAEFQFKDSTLWISAINKITSERLRISIPFYLNTYHNIDTFSNNFIASHVNLSGNITCDEYYNIDKEKDNQFIVTKSDKEKLIINGIFDFTLISIKCKDTLVITEGFIDYSFK